jgi:hypothetical protein
MVKVTPITVSFFIVLVEASGFEPLSENNVTIASTSIVVEFESRLMERPTTGNPLDQPDYLRHLSPGGEQMPHPTKVEPYSINMGD